MSIKTAKMLVLMPLSQPESTGNATIISSAIFKSAIGGHGFSFSLEAKYGEPLDFVPVLCPPAMSVNGVQPLKTLGFNIGHEASNL